MRFEDMKNNIPETPDFIHVMIQNEVDRQLHGTTIIQIPKKRKKWNGARVQRQQWSACWQLPQQLMRV